MASWLLCAAMSVGTSRAAVAFQNWLASSSSTSEPPTAADSESMMMPP